MKGVNKRVIEINEPDSEYIEKVLVFLRQKDGRVNVARARQEAAAVAGIELAGTENADEQDTTQQEEGQGSDGEDLHGDSDETSPNDPSQEDKS